MLTDDGAKIIVPAMNIQMRVTDDMLEEANRELAHYAGAIAMLSLYTASHSRLVIHVTRGHGPGEYWSFSFVGRVCMPTLWHMVRPSVKRQDAESFVFSDEGVEFDAVELVIQDAAAWYRWKRRARSRVVRILDRCGSRLYRVLRGLSSRDN